MKTPKPPAAKPRKKIPMLKPRIPTMDHRTIKPIKPIKAPKLPKDEASD